MWSRTIVLKNLLTCILTIIQGIGLYFWTRLLVIGLADVVFLTFSVGRLCFCFLLSFTVTEKQTAGAVFQYSGRYITHFVTNDNVKSTAFHTTTTTTTHCLLLRPYLQPTLCLTYSHCLL